MPAYHYGTSKEWDQRFKPILILGSGQFGEVTLYKVTDEATQQALMADGLCDDNGLIAVKNAKSDTGREVNKINDDYKYEGETAEHLHKQSQDRHHPAYNLARACQVGTKHMILTRLEGNYYSHPEVIKYIDEQIISKNKPRTPQNLTENKYNIDFQINRITNNNQNAVPLISGTASGFLKKMAKESGPDNPYLAIIAMQIRNSQYESLSALHNAGVLSNDVAARNTLMQAPLPSELNNGFITNYKAVAADYGLSAIAKTCAPNDICPMRWYNRTALKNHELNKNNDLYGAKVTTIELIASVCGYEPGSIPFFKKDPIDSWKKAQGNNPACFEVEIDDQLQKIAHTHPNYKGMIESCMTYMLSSPDTNATLGSGINERNSFEASNEHFIKHTLISLANDNADDLRTINSSKMLLHLSVSESFKESPGYQQLIEIAKNTSTNANVKMIIDNLKEQVRDYENLWNQERIAKIAVLRDEIESPELAIKNIIGKTTNKSPPVTAYGFLQSKSDDLANLANYGSIEKTLLLDFEKNKPDIDMNIRQLVDHVNSPHFDRFAISNQLNTFNIQYSKYINIICRDNKESIITILNAITRPPIPLGTHESVISFINTLTSANEAATNDIIDNHLNFDIVDKSVKDIISSQELTSQSRIVMINKLLQNKNNDKLISKLIKVSDANDLIKLVENNKIHADFIRSLIAVKCKDNMNFLSEIVNNMMASHPKSSNSVIDYIDNVCKSDKSLAEKILKGINNDALASIVNSGHLSLETIEFLFSIKSGDSTLMKDACYTMAKRPNNVIPEIIMMLAERRTLESITQISTLINQLVDNNEAVTTAISSLHQSELLPSILENGTLSTKAIASITKSLPRDDAATILSDSLITMGTKNPPEITQASRMINELAKSNNIPMYLLTDGFLKSLLDAGVLGQAATKIICQENPKLIMNMLSDRQKYQSFTPSIAESTSYLINQLHHNKKFDLATLRHFRSDLLNSLINTGKLSPDITNSICTFNHDLIYRRILTLQRRSKYKSASANEAATLINHLAINGQLSLLVMKKFSDKLLEAMINSGKLNHIVTARICQINPDIIYRRIINIQNITPNNSKILTDETSTLINHLCYIAKMKRSSYKNLSKKYGSLDDGFLNILIKTGRLIPAAIPSIKASNDRGMLSFNNFNNIAPSKITKGLIRSCSAVNDLTKSNNLKRAFRKLQRLSINSLLISMLNNQLTRETVSLMCTNKTRNQTLMTLICSNINYESPENLFHIIKMIQGINPNKEMAIQASILINQFVRNMNPIPEQIKSSLQIQLNSLDSSFLSDIVKTKLLSPNVSSIVNTSVTIDTRRNKVYTRQGSSVTLFNPTKDEVEKIHKEVTDTNTDNKNRNKINTRKYTP